MTRTPANPAKTFVTGRYGYPPFSRGLPQGPRFTVARSVQFSMVIDKRFDRKAQREASGESVTEKKRRRPGTEAG